MNRASLMFTIAALLLVGLQVAAQVETKPLAKYQVIVVEQFQVQTLAEKENFPAGYEGVLQKTTLAKLAARRMFDQVIDGTEPPPTTQGSAATAEPKRKLLLSGSVIGYDKGSRTARWMVGFGAGKTRVKVRFIFRDAETGQEIWRKDEEGTFAGSTTIGGGAEEKGIAESTRKVAEALIKEMALVR